MDLPPIVSPQESDAARQELLVKEGSSDTSVGGLPV
jgi:hypothetical protein